MLFFLIEVSTCENVVCNQLYMILYLFLCIVGIEAARKMGGEAKALPCNVFQCIWRDNS